jgi:hypothetical protein
MKKIIIGVMVVGATLGLMWLGQLAQPAVLNSSVASNGSPSTLVAATSLFDFGRISMAKGKVETVFTVTNAGPEELALETLITSCMCTVAYLESPRGEQGPFGMPGHGGPSRRVAETMKPGETRRLRVVFDPGAHGPAGVGPIARSIILTDAAGASLELEIKALVTP